MKGNVALVTGASRGIGRVLAMRLAEKGVNLMLVSRSAQDLETVKSHVEQQGIRAVIKAADLADADIPSQIIARCIEDFGRLDYLINNAGIAIPKPLCETTVQEWDMHMELNARAPFLLCKQAVPYLQCSKDATIINISSVVGVKGYVNQAAYTASKHALMGMSNVLAQEVQDLGIRVHTICPGGVATDMVIKMRPDLDVSGLISPDEIADIVLFLLNHRHSNAVIDDIHVRRANNKPWF
ncbi:MAG: SDR family NAD(P)-dependent oxidoreductase [Clostridia bacterium]|nr:SDR family NAD(P)-dependent oxidoreductase [Clostridia bacterium]